MSELKEALDRDMYEFYTKASEYAIDEGVKEYFLEMGKSEERKSKSFLKNILVHMIKCLCQPNRLSSSWLDSIKTSYNNLQDVFEDSPSLIEKTESLLDSIYVKATKEAETEMKSNPHDEIPKNCPWSFNELMDHDFVTDFRLNAIKNNKNPYFDPNKYSI